MSVDFYVAVPAAHWPDAAAIQTCMVAHDYPVQIKRFPRLINGKVVTDGALVVIDGKDAYLQGAASVASLVPQAMEDINDQLAASASRDTIKPDDVLVTIHVQSPSEMRAASYVVSALIICFEGFGFEPQGNTSGRAAYAQSLILGAEALKGL